MTFKLFFANEAQKQLTLLEQSSHLKKRIKAVRKALSKLEIDPRHPSLNTHKFYSLHGPDNEEIFEAYAENNTPGAYRIFWYYGPNKKEITIVAIVHHP